MAIGIFDNKEIVPNDEDLENVLKGSLSVYNELISFLENDYGPLTNEWKFYSKEAGWTLKISNKKRNLLFFSPNEDYFLVTVSMGMKVSKIVLDSDISDNTKDLIKQATVCGGGNRYILIEIRNEEDLEDIKTIINIRDN